MDIGAQHNSDKIFMCQALKKWRAVLQLSLAIADARRAALNENMRKIKGLC